MHVYRQVNFVTFSQAKLYMIFTTQLVTEMKLSFCPG